MPKTKTVKVRIKSTVGIYGIGTETYSPGDEVEIEERFFQPHYMEKIEEPAKPPKKEPTPTEEPTTPPPSEEVGEPAAEAEPTEEVTEETVADTSISESTASKPRRRRRSTS